MIARVMPAIARVMLALACIMVLAPAAASARGFGHDHVVWFHDVTVDPDEEIDGNLVVLFGNATIAGKVDGDVTVIGGTLETLPGYEIDGTTKELADLSLNSLVPWIAPGTAFSPLLRENRHIVVALAYGVVNLFIFLLFPVRVRLALERVERHPGLSALTGVFALIAIIPVALLLLISIVGIPLIVLEIAAVFAGVWLGQSAVALLVGRRMYELVRPQTTPSPLGALVLGLIIVTCAEIVPFVGWAVTALVWLVGLGAAILAFVREANLGPPLGRPPMAPAGGPPVGGPPMTSTTVG